MSSSNNINKLNSKFIRKTEVIDQFQDEYEKNNTLHIQNIFYGNVADYYGYNYNVDEYNNDGVSTRSIDTYNVESHRFVDEVDLHVSRNTNDSRELKINAKTLFPLSDFANNVHEKFETADRNTKRHMGKKHRFSKRQLNKYYKLTAGEKRERKYIANNSDDDNEDSSDGEVYVEDGNYQPSDDESDNYLLYKSSKLSYDICSNIVQLSNSKVKLIGIATKNGYLNFKLIDQENDENNDGISLYLKSSIIKIFSSSNDSGDSLGLISCILQSGDMFFVEFFYTPTDSSFLKDQITYKFNLLRKSRFQNSAYKDIKFYKKEINGLENTYHFVIIDRYGNYTSGKIESHESEPNLHVEIENCLDDDLAFKGVVFDPMNIEFPYKNILLGPSEDTLFVVDNTKIVSVNKTNKTAVLISQFKFWSSIINCSDSPKYVVILTNIEIKIFEKGISDTKIALLKNVLSIKHYLNLARYDDLSLDVSFDKDNKTMFVLLKKPKLLYTISINQDTKEVALLNTLPFVFKVLKMKTSLNDTCSLVGTELSFLYDVEYERSICVIDLRSVLENISLGSNYGIISVEVKSQPNNNTNKGLLMLERFEKTFTIKNRVKRAIINGKTLTSDKQLLNKNKLHNYTVVEEFADNFYTLVAQRFEKNDISGCVVMSEIDLLPHELISSEEFYDFNNQFTRTINENTPFRVVNFYNTRDVNPAQIWSSQMIMHKGDSNLSKKNIVTEYEKNYDTDSSAMVYQSLKGWNPNKFSAVDNDRMGSQNTKMNHTSMLKKLNMSTSKLFNHSFSHANDSSFNISLNGISQLPISSQFNIKHSDSILIESTQKMEQKSKETINNITDNEVNDASATRKKRAKKLTSKSKEPKIKNKKPKKTSGFF